MTLPLVSSAANLRQGGSPAANLCQGGRGVPALPGPESGSPCFPVSKLQLVPRGPKQLLDLLDCFALFPYPGAYRVKGWLLRQRFLEAFRGTGTNLLI